MNLVARLGGALERRGRAVVLVGDSIVDHWVHGAVENCQEGCPKFVEANRCWTMGGVNNARSCLSRWPKVRTEVHCASWSPPSQKWRFVGEEGRVVFRWDCDNPAVMTAGEGAVARDRALESIENADAVLLSDYDKGFLTEGLVQAVVERCRARKVPCVADAKRPPEFYCGALIKANDAWLEQHKVVERAECSSFDGVVTHGAWEPTVNGVAVPTSFPWVPCVNHVGAGDCFAAYLALALACGFDVVDAATLAHSAGRVYVQHPHNRAPFPLEVVADLSSALPTQRPTLGR